MSVKIRLTRTGARNSAAFRVVAADSRSPRDGRFIEILGWYDPKLKGENSNIKQDRVDHWLGQGAEISDTVKSLVKRQSVAPEAVAEDVLADEPTDVAEEAPASEIPDGVEAPVAEDDKVATDV